MNLNSIKEVTHKEAISIITNRVPLGTFWELDNGKYIGIDNSDGDAWTEEFTTKEQCFNYLNNL